MARGRSREAWNHTAMLLAKIHNAWCVSEGATVGPEHFHPFMQREMSRKPALRAKGVRILKQVFIDKKL